MIKHLWIVGIYLAAACILAGCSDSQQEEQPAGRVNFGAVQEVPARSFAKVWDADLSLKGGERISRLFLRGDLIFVYTDANNVFAVDRKAGTLAFICGQVTDPGKIMRSPVVFPGMVAFPTSHTLECYDLSGKFLRSMNLGFSTTSDGVGMGMVMVIGSDEPAGRIALIDMTKFYGYHKWSLVTGMILGAPVSDSGACYVGSSSDGAVYAVNEDRGTTWALDDGVFRTYGPIVADMKADTNGVYATSTDARVYCIDRASGKLKWEYFATEPLTVAPAVTSSMLYLPVRGTGIVALDKLKGAYLRQPKWISPTGSELVAEDAKLAYMLNRDNSLSALDKVTGETKFQSGATGFVAYAHNTKDGVIYAAGGDGHVYAVKGVTTAGSMGEIVGIGSGESPAIASAK